MITVVTPVSPIRSHPDTAILAETVRSVRYHLPDAEIILTFDGVRPEQEHRRIDYEEHIRRVLWSADHEWGGVCPFVFDRHLHQTGMMWAVIDEIRTPLLMYVEQDTPLVTDELIDWPAVIRFIGSGAANLVRFHHEARIPAEHRHMMHGTDGMFVRTSQWSQRPHVAATSYYRSVMQNFTPDACSFIEDKMHGVCHEAYRIHGMAGWQEHRLHIYAPEGNIKRSYHLDGRAGEAKYEDKQVF